MEPASTHQPADESPGHGGRSGTLANPEVHEDVPGHVIPILEREFDDFHTEATKFLAGDTPEDQFIGFRLKQGVYGQRQADVQMIRVKLPLGGISPEQMDAFGDAVEEYAPLRKGHITTRQYVQVHHMPLPITAQFMRRDQRRGPVLARGLRQHRPQRHRRPVGRRVREASCSTPRPTSAPTCATSCATTSAS